MISPLVGHMDTLITRPTRRSLILDRILLELESLRTPLGLPEFISLDQRAENTAKRFDFR